MMQFRVGSANLNKACEMQSIDARIQFGIESTNAVSMMYRARCMQDKCMNARMHSIRYANLNMTYYKPSKQVSKREERSGGWKTYTHSPTLITDLPSL